MRKLFLICCLLLSAASFAQPSKLSESMNAAQWQEDLVYFKNQLEKKHKNAYHTVSKEEFEKEVDQLFKDIPTLKDYQIVVRFMQLTAKIGDGHTAVHLPESFKRYPFVLQWFDKDLYVIAATQENKETIGTRVLRIGNLSMEEVNKRIRTILSEEENRWFEMNTSAALLAHPEILVTLGIVNEYEKAGFTLLDSVNKEITVQFTPVPLNPMPSWLRVSPQVPLFRQKQGDPFWFTFLEDINAVYLNFKNYDDLNKNSDKLFAFIEEKKASRLIVDLRFNGGGDFLKGRRQLLSKIRDNKVLNQKGNLFVITGRRTFSAAMVNSIDFKKETNAIIIGEPPGEIPNSYSENNEMKLPNSKLIISYSTRYYKFLDVDTPAFEPDVRIDPEWKSFKEGRDPVMEYIINYSKNPGQKKGF